MRDCRPDLGSRIEAHIEVFAENRVVILPTGIGVRGAKTLDGRVIRARCFGPIVTLDPTGVVLSAARGHPTVGKLFADWGQPLSRLDLAGFRVAPRNGRVRVYVNGRRRPGGPRDVPITRAAEVVLEVGPYVPPHKHFTFAPLGKLRPWER